MSIQPTSFRLFAGNQTDRLGLVAKHRNEREPASVDPLMTACLFFFFFFFFFRTQIRRVDLEFKTLQDLRLLPQFGMISHKGVSSEKVGPLQDGIGFPLGFSRRPSASQKNTDLYCGWLRNPFRTSLKPWLKP